MTGKEAGEAAAHYDLLDERCFQVVAGVIAELEAARVDYVLGGGWSVYAYGSGVPSVDTDVFLAATDFLRVSEALEARGITVGRGAQFEPLALTAPNHILGPDVELQEPERGYVPATSEGGSNGAGWSSARSEARPRPFRPRRPCCS